MDDVTETFNRIDQFYASAKASWRHRDYSETLRWLSRMDGQLFMLRARVRTRSEGSTDRGAPEIQDA